MDDSTQLWIQLARDGDPAAQQALWDRFFPQLVRLARQRLQNQPLRVGDEEDVALSVLESFFRASQDPEKKNLQQLRGGDQLWRLLSRMTQRKVIDYLRHAQRQKRQVVGESALGPASPDDPRAIDGRTDPLPSPLLELIVADEVRQRLQQLNDPMRHVAVAKLEGYTNQEIAERLGCSLATVERRLKMIRELWSQAADHGDDSTPARSGDPSADSG
ncbi:MAG: sigma-70 family RNA polymerase sigma factor [Pirellulales bacterium]